MKLSFEAWTMPAHMGGFDVQFITPPQKPYTPLWEWAEMLHNYGYEGLSAFYPFFQWMQHKGSFKKDLKRLIETLESLDMEFDAIACHCMNPSPRGWVRDGSVRLFNRAIEIAKELGANTVISCGGGRHLFNLDDEKAWNYSVDQWKQVSKKAEEVGQNISMEICALAGGGQVVMCSKDAAKFLDEVGSERLYVVWDTAQMHIGDMNKMSIEEGIKLLGDRINEMHLKDVSGTHWNQAYVWYGQGEVNFEETFRALKSIGYDGFASVEYETFLRSTWPHGMLDLERAAKDTAIFMRKHGLY